jgi:hypothetical protein
MTVVTLACSPLAAAEPPLCKDPTYRDAHNEYCIRGAEGPPGTLPGGGGPGTGGLLGLLRRLTGGLL